MRNNLTTFLSATALAAGLAAAPLAGPVLAQDGEVQTKQYEDGGVYEGTFKDGLQHGTGTYRLPNGYEYTGDWVEGEIRGRGHGASRSGTGPRSGCRWHRSPHLVR
jgi:hypothetical protein